MIDDGGGYAAMRAGGDRSGLEAELANAAAAFSVNWPAWTSEVRFTDRLLRWPKSYANDYADPQLARPDPGVLYETLTGDIGDPLYLPLPAVRWQTEPTDLAALVTDAERTSFGAELYHFGADEREMGARLLRLDSGDYGWSLTCGGTVVDAGEISIAGDGELAFSLPPGVECALVVE